MIGDRGLDKISCIGPNKNEQPYNIGMVQKYFDFRFNLNIIIGWWMCNQ